MLCRKGKQGRHRADAPLQLTDKAERKGERDGESGRLPERFSGQRRFRPHLSDGGSACGRVLVLAERSDATCTRQAHAPSSNLLNTPKEEEIMHRLSCVKSNFLFEMANVGACFSLSI